MKSQTQLLMRDFDRGKKHTIFTAMTKLGCGALHQRISELRERGYPIARELVWKNGRKVAQFSKDWSAA